MKLLVLHRIPYHKVRYHLGIDHEAHEVVYFGTAQAMSSLPAELRCRRVTRPGAASAATEALACFEPSERFDRVISLSEYELMDAAQLRSAWNVPGPLPADVELVRDKVGMKDAVQESGIRAPRFVNGSDAVSRPAAITWSGRTVLKPRCGASSEGVRIVPTPLEAVRLLEELTDGDSARREGWEIEEYVDGAILHLDGLLADGRILLLVASEYVGTCLAYAEGKPLGSFQLDPCDRLVAWAQRCLEAVRMREGSFHLEAIRGEEGPVFLEVANRVGGADVVDTFELATGVFLPAEELRLCIGEHFSGSARSALRAHYGWFVFPGHHLEGAARCRVHAAGVRSAEGVVRWNELTSGAPLPRKITYQATEAPAAGIVRGGSSEEVRALLQRIFAEVQVQPA